MCADTKGRAHTQHPHFLSPRKMPFSCCSRTYSVTAHQKLVCHLPFNSSGKPSSFLEGGMRSSIAQTQLPKPSWRRGGVCGGHNSCWWGVPLAHHPVYYLSNLLFLEEFSIRNSFERPIFPSRMIQMFSFVSASSLSLVTVTIS